MKNTIKKIGVATILIFSNLIFAQKGSFYFGLQTGKTTINNNTAFANNYSDFSTGFKVGYAYNLNSDFAIGTGVEYAAYRQNISLNDNVYSSILIDNTDSAFEYRQSTTAYLENQVLNAVQIPIFVQYKKSLGGNYSIYSRLGGKLLIPTKFKIDASAKSITTSGYYPDFNLEITDVPSNGFETVNNWKENGTYKTKLACMASAELGIDFKLKQSNSIYLGVFVDYGLSDVVDNKNSDSIIGYDATAAGNSEVNGIFAYDKNSITKPLFVGISLGYNLSK
jgi:hypothetical protein